MPFPTVPTAAPTPMDTYTPAQALNAGIVAAEPDKAKEQADVRRWVSRINRTLSFDEPARKNYIKCRRYARGDSGFVVDANIVGTNIDILEAFIYAKNPDVDVTPAKAVEVPSMEAMLDAAILTAEQDPRVQQAMSEAAMAPTMGVDMGLDPTGAVMEGQIPADPNDPAAVQAAVQAARATAIQAIAAENLAKIKAEYQRRTRENKAFAETSELVISSMWKQGRLKDRGRPWVRSALTTGTGVIKCSWQQRTAPSPETVTAINDLQQQIERVKALRIEIEDEAAGQERDANEAELARQLEALTNQTEPVVSRGYVIDLVTPENFVVAPGFRIADHMDAPWNAERIPMELEEAIALFRLTKEQQGKVTKYMARRPSLTRPESANLDDVNSFDVREAESFVRGDGETDTGAEFDTGSTGMQGAGCFVMVWEIWDRTSNSVLTTIEGIEAWVKPSWNPCATTRFYPFFLFCTSEVDGQRHPQSPVERSAKLVDEYNRIGSAEAKHRRRIIPKTAFNAGAFDKGEAEKLEKADIQEMVALKLTNPTADIRTVLLPITYAALDVALYDRQRINSEIERIWGVQEALGGSMGNSPDKTATQVDVEQQGFQARTGSRRDAIEATLSHSALYTLEVGRCYLTDEDVRMIAGPNAFWPPYQGADDLRRMVDVDIRAGTTGKPNTKAAREAWGVLLPQLDMAIKEYAQLVGADPRDLAESIKKLARITAERAGDSLDIDSLFPEPGQPMVDPATGMPAPQPGAPGDPAAGGDPTQKPAAGGPPPKPGANKKPAAPAAPAPAAVHA